MSSSVVCPNPLQSAGARQPPASSTALAWPVDGNQSLLLIGCGYLGWVAGLTAFRFPIGMRFYDDENRAIESRLNLALLLPPSLRVRLSVDVC